MAKVNEGVTEGEKLWTPDPDSVAKSHVARFMRRLADERDLSFATYDELWHWSVTDLVGFWSAVWQFFEVESEQPYERVLGSRSMPGAVWFPGSRVNYAEHVLRRERTAAPGEAALVHASELRPLAQMTWHDLGAAVRLLATQLRALGTVPGDPIVAYMPNIPETVIAMLATTAIGAVWSSAAPEFGARTVIDRFAQIKPKVFFAADGFVSAARITTGGRRSAPSSTRCRRSSASSGYPISIRRHMRRQRMRSRGTR